MNAAAALERAPAGIIRLQYRGSDDAIVWTGWRDIPDERALVEWFKFYQGRIVWPDGSTSTSPIETDIIA